MNKNHLSLERQQVIKRLKIIRDLISLEEEQDINDQLHKLKDFETDIEIKSIITLIKDQSYSEACTLIEEFINKFNQLSIFIDPEIETLRFEAKTLESRIQQLSNEKSELDKIIHEFSVRHNQELGELIIKILSYRREKLQDTPEYQEADQDYNEYFNNYELSKDENIPNLTSQEQKELKELYRKATKLCHPDIVEEDQQQDAHKIFIDLKEAYESNDLRRVKEIYNDLIQGKVFTSKSDASCEKSILQQEIERLRSLIKNLNTEINKIKESDTYLTIKNIIDWDDYFSKTKKQLEAQLHNFKNE